MQHIINSDADSHVWRGLLIRELTPADAPYHGSLVEVEVPAATSHPVARSTRCETYYYCVRGKVDFEVGGKGGVLGPGDLLVVEPNEWYSYRTGDSAVLLSFNVPAWDAAASEYRDDAVSTTEP